MSELINKSSVGLNKVQNELQVTVPEFEALRNKTVGFLRTEVKNITTNRSDQHISLDVTNFYLTNITLNHARCNIRISGGADGMEQYILVHNSKDHNIIFGPEVKTPFGDPVAVNGHAGSTGSTPTLISMTKLGTSYYVNSVTSY